MARRSGAMALFIPHEGRGFVSPNDGSVALKKILVPVDHRPDPQTALDKALLLARGARELTGVAAPIAPCSRCLRRHDPLAISEAMAQEFKVRLKLFS